MKIRDACLLRLSMIGCGVFFTDKLSQIRNKKNAAAEAAAFLGFLRTSSN
jgi:hypothetical protein